MEKEQIISEIERQKESASKMVEKMGDAFGLYYVGRLDLCNILLDLIKSE